MAAPRKHVATRTKATAVPWPEFALRAMPSATVEIKTIRPPGTDAPSHRRSDITSQPSTRPERNGHEVDDEPGDADPMGVDHPTDPHENKNGYCVCSHSRRAHSAKSQCQPARSRGRLLRAAQCERRRETRDWLF